MGGAQGSSLGPAALAPVALVAGLAGSLLGTGCTGPCEGPGCESAYSGALVGVHRGTARLSGSLDPLDVAASLEGQASQGPDWAVALLPQRMVVGIPDLALVYDISLASVAEGDQQGAVLDLTTPEGSILGGGATSRLGASLARSRDHDGDGVADLLVGAPGTRRAEDSVDDGAVMLFTGLGDGLGASYSPDDAALTVLGEDAGGQLGEVVVACADLDGDGLDDWAASAPRADGQEDLVGRVVVGLSTDTGNLDPVIEADALPTSWFGQDLGARAGNGLACDQDHTGDGQADLVVGVPFADHETEGEAVGAVHVLAGGKTMEAGGSNRLLSEAAALSVYGTESQEWLGWSVAAGDLDGSGTVELVAGAPGWDGQRGRVKVWTDSGRPELAVTWVLSLEGEESPDTLGRTVRAADLDGDGIDDLLLGAPRHNPEPDDAVAGYDSGKLYLVPGAEDHSWWGLGQPVLDRADTTWVRSQQYLRTGATLGLGDFDEDGVIDMVLVHRTDPG